MLKHERYHNRSIFTFIKDAKKRGIPVVVDGRQIRVSDAASLLELLEKYTYMIDYESDEQGRIVQVSYNRITKY